jgi:hypothetical protein
MSSELGQRAVKDIQWKDDELSFRLAIERQGQEINIIYKGKITGDAIKGKTAINFSGRNLSFPFEGNRTKEGPTLAGLWKFDLVTESGTKVQPSVRLNQLGSRVTGRYLGLSGKEIPIEEVVVKNDELSFRVTDQLDNEKIIFRFRGKRIGERINGTVEIGEGKQTASRKFEAQRVQTKTAQVAGGWKLTVPYQQGITFESTVKLSQQGSALTGSYLGDQGETPISDALVLGDEITFEVSRNRDGKKYKLKYSGKITGDTIKGSVDYNFDSMAGVLDFEGKRLNGEKKESTTKGAEAPEKNRSEKKN